MDAKGIGKFLLIVFGVGWVLQGALFFFNFISLRDLGFFGMVVLIALFYLPWIAARMALRSAPAAAPSIDPPKPMTWGIFLPAALLAPVVFVASYTALVYVTPAFSNEEIRPDWTLGKLFNELRANMEQLGQTLDQPSVGVTTTVLVMGFLLTIVLGGTVYALVVLGGEKGWRGFLLPRLLPMGRVFSYVVIGLLWGLWFFPVILDWFVEFGPEGRRFAEGRSFFLRFLCMSVFLSIILGEIWRRNRSAGLTAVVLGGFLGQMHGGGLSMWSYLFTRDLQPWTGSFGVASLGVWGLAALVAVVLPGRWGEAATEEVADSGSPSWGSGQGLKGHKGRKEPAPEAIARVAFEEAETRPIQEDQQVVEPPLPAKKHAKSRPARRKAPAAESAETPKAEPPARPKSRPRKKSS
ncbi:MAG TPA: hypothetical protein PKI11_17695 [Candidatus Hydrogenedentes bacterium]|nr:hypothetical protein [Candidatus Hydrogenedentota bacterium]HNT88595.1 hypothetical protein [Candidatus Hydrogenedentota bacterium]